VFLALDIATFRPQRQSLYKELRIQRGEAIYLFEADLPRCGERRTGSRKTVPAARGSSSLAGCWRAVPGWMWTSSLPAPGREGCASDSISRR
jgi:hypothetical protein